MQQPTTQNFGIKITKTQKSIVPQGQPTLMSPEASKQMNSPTELDSPGRRKKNLILARSKASEVQKVHNQLNSYIDVLDNKVVKLVQKHEAEFLVAYRNHIKKVRQEMEEIRNKALSNANSTVSQTQKIQTLQKQLTIFREQSLKLFQKVNQKQNIIYTLKAKIADTEAQNKFLQKNIKQLIKRNKQLQGFHYQKSMKNQQQSFLNDKQFFISRPLEGKFNAVHKASAIKYINKQQLNKTGSTFSISRPYTTGLNSKGASTRSRNHSIQINSIQTQNNKNKKFQKQSFLNQIHTLLASYQVDQILATKIKQKIAEIISDPCGVQKYEASNKQMFNKKLPKSLHSESKIHAKKSEMQEYFFKSIQAVRKQITRRRDLKSRNFYKQYAGVGLNQFKKVDFFRLLELMLSNEKVITAVHKAIFELSTQIN